MISGLRQSLLSHMSAMIASLVLTAAVSAGAADVVDLRVRPDQIELSSPESSDQVLVFGTADDGTETDLSRDVQYSAADPIVEISASGRVIPVRDGSTILTVRHGSRQVMVPVSVRGLSAPEPVSFRHEIIPVLSKAGCNSGGCHGKAEGQNGFKLSVFGYDAAADYDAIVRDGRGRRVFPGAPSRSLMLTKATGDVPHGGGLKIERNSRWQRLLLRWISEGLQLDAASENPVSEIRIEPAVVTLGVRGSQQLRVIAVTSGGSSRCVTAEADYQSNNDVVAAVNRDGLIEAATVAGEAAILVRYMGQVGVCRVTRPGPPGTFARPAENSFVDQLVWDKLERLRVAPAGPADDATFLRRVFLDTIGTLPTPAEARDFLADDSPGKRGLLIDRLLERPEYSVYWTQRWADLLQVDKDIVTPQGAFAMTRWVHRQLADNLPFDQFVRSILTAEGSTVSESPAGFFQVQSDPEKSARAVSQLFLGIRIECAQCHHHPFEKWDRKDYYGWAGFFTGIERRAAAAGSLKIVSTAGEDLKHPATGLAVPATPLGDATADLGNGGERRRFLAQWVTSGENPWFARTLANRLVAHYFGRGLVEPLDDLRATNPATNEPLLQALADHLRELRFDVRAFTRTLLNSQVYQLSAETSESNQLDEQNYSHAAWKPLPAEVLLDAVSQVMGVPEQFNGWPLGYRAIEIWDNKLPSHFLQVFGRPARQSVCACERGSEPAITQALHLMNSESTTRRLADPHGFAARLAGSNLTDDQIVEEIYLAALNRFPGEAERELMNQAFAQTADRREGVEDVLWTLLNTREFVFNH